MGFNSDAHVAKYGQEIIVADDLHAVARGTEQDAIAVEDGFGAGDQAIDIACGEILPGVLGLTEDNRGVSMGKHLVPNINKPPY